MESRLWQLHRAILHGFAHLNSYYIMFIFINVHAALTAARGGHCEPFNLVWNEAQLNTFLSHKCLMTPEMASAEVCHYFLYGQCTA